MMGTKVTIGIGDIIGNSSTVANIVAEKKNLKVNCNAKKIFAHMKAYWS